MFLDIERRYPVSVTFARKSENLFVIHIKGILTFEDLKEVENKARAEIDRSQKVKLLILAEQFSGWGKKGNWGDLTFMYEYDLHIERIAVVTNRKWTDEVLMFLGTGRRNASVESFHNEEDASDWLQSESK
jgi:hypothetical protein